MKFKVSKKEIKGEYHKIISLRYCQANYMIYHLNPFAYSSGINGWSCDYYDIDGILISTGYGPVKSKNATASNDLIEKYDKKASKVLSSKESWDKRKKKLDVLLHDFITEATR